MCHDLAFFGCLRLSNLVPASQAVFDPLKQLTRDDIRFSDGLVLVFFKWAKTNQNSSKVSWIPICPVQDTRFDISVQLKKLFEVAKARSCDPVFTFEKSKFHTRNSLVKLLDKCVKEAGLAPDDYSWHSFRRGAAVFAFELGLADSAVQLLGDCTKSGFKDTSNTALKNI